MLTFGICPANNQLVHKLAIVLLLIGCGSPKPKEEKRAKSDVASLSPSTITFGSEPIAKVGDILGGSRSEVREAKLQIGEGEQSDLRETYFRLETDVSKKILVMKGAFPVQYEMTLAGFSKVDSTTSGEADECDSCLDSQYLVTHLDDGALELMSADGMPLPEEQRAFLIAHFFGDRGELPTPLMRILPAEITAGESLPLSSEQLAIWGHAAKSKITSGELLVVAGRSPGLANATVTMKSRQPMLGGSAYWDLTLRWDVEILKANRNTQSTLLAVNGKAGGTMDGKAVTGEMKIRATAKLSVDSGDASP
ncbi:MAG: hypothetical protein GY811_06395 [Myxococcales bacterium]|nr:hypothetical protein [Myxococcales bacterium]